MSSEDELDLLSMVQGVFSHHVESSESDDLCPKFVALQQVDARYGEPSLIGRGARKEVYRCMDLRVMREVAYATLRPEFSKPHFDSFIYEARLTASLAHPNIIKVYDLGVTTEGRPYFTMDLKSAVDMKAYAEEADREELLSIFATVCQAVSYAHSQGVLHLDLKPENIQCDQFGEVLVCDWGLGRIMDCGEQDFAQLELQTASRATLHGDIKGTPGYMAPEQVEKGGVKDERTDVYALGAVLYYLLTKQRTFQGSLAEVLTATVEEEVSPAHLINPSVPKPLSLIAQKALRKNKNERYATVKEVYKEIVAYQSLQATQAEQPNFFRHCALFIQRHRRVMLSLLLFLIVLGGVQLWNAKRIGKLESEEARLNRMTQSMTYNYRELNDEYETFERALSGDKMDLSGKLLAAAQERYREFQGVGEYTLPEDPVGLLEEVEVLAHKSLQLNETRRARQIMVYSLCVKLNFRDVPTYAVELKHEKYERWAEYASAHPEFNYNKESRPSVSALAEFYNSMGGREDFDFEYLRKVMFYDLRVRREEENLTEALVAYLKAINQKKSTSIRYDKEKKVLEIDQPRALYHRIHYAPGSLYQYLELEKCVFTGDDVNLEGLNGAYIQELDLSQVELVTVTNKVSIRGLQKVKLKENTPEQMKMKIYEALGLKWHGDSVGSH